MQKEVYNLISEIPKMFSNNLISTLASMSSLKERKEDFPSGPEADSALPKQGAQVWSLARELVPTCHN